MNSKNKFGFEPLETKSVGTSRRRSPGPMGTAVREAAASLQESTEEKVVQRRQNASDAKEYRVAQQEGRVLVHLPLDSILVDDLPRDRLELDAVATSDEMDELVASIRRRGQQEAIEVFLDSAGGYQLKKGWRRLTALRRLFDETGDEQFANAIVRVSSSEDDRLALYTDMVEENIIREDLTFAEMAQLAITASKDEAFEGVSADEMVGRIYASLHKMKRSYIRSFVYLLQELGDALQWPKEVSRNLGVDVSRRLKATPDVGSLLGGLNECRSPQAQSEVLAAFVSEVTKSRTAEPKRAREKFEFHVGSVKVTARSGECRIVDERDYTLIPKERLERAIRAFQDALNEAGNPRVTRL